MSGEEYAKPPVPCANCGHEAGTHQESAPSCWCGCKSYVRSDAGIYVRHDDGTVSEAVPLGWQGHGIDWEIYRPGDSECVALGVRWIARGYDEDVLIAEVYARGPRRLNRRMRAAEKAHDLPRNGVL